MGALKDCHGGKIGTLGIFLGQKTPDQRHTNNDAECHTGHEQKRHEGGKEKNQHSCEGL